MDFVDARPLTGPYVMWWSGAGVMSVGAGLTALGGWDLARNGGACDECAIFPAFVILGGMIHIAAGTEIAASASIWGASRLRTWPVLGIGAGALVLAASLVVVTTFDGRSGLLYAGGGAAVAAMTLSAVQLFAIDTRISVSATGLAFRF